MLMKTPLRGRFLMRFCFAGHETLGLGLALLKHLKISRTVAYRS